MKTVAIPFTMQIPVISTRHLPHAGALDEPMHYGTIVAKHDTGAFVQLAKPAEYFNDFHWLYAISKWAEANVYEWVRFDVEGDIVDGLEVFDWEAGNGRAMIGVDLAAPGADQTVVFDTVSNEGTPITTVMGLPVFGTPVVACNESISHGTHRPQDLIPAFGKVLEQLYPRALPLEFMALPHGMYQLAVEEGDSAAWWDSEDASELLQDLIGTLDDHAPEGFYFGTHPGDGSDFGFWENEED